MDNISELIRQFAILAVPILIAVTFHEVAHGYMAYFLGDPSAKNAGRLTFNPLRHLDPLGTLALFLVKVGWAKPVPVDPRYFERPRQGMVLVSLAGPAINFLLAVFFALAFHALFWAFGNSPSPHLVKVIQPLVYMCQAGVIINIGLGIFNLLPIPPLDGSNILSGLLPPDWARAYEQKAKYGFVLLIILFLTGAIQKIIVPIIYNLAALLLPL